MTLRGLADEVFRYRLEDEPYLRVRRGLPVEHLRCESESTWAQDAAFARQILTRVHATEPEDEDDRLTAGFLEHLLTGWTSRSDNALLGFTVTPYSSFFLGMGLQQAFGSFTGADAAYLQLVADHRDQVADMADRLLRQREAGVLVPQAAIPGVLESLRRSKKASSDVVKTSAPSSVRQHVERLLEREVLPAFERLLDVLDDGYVADAPDQVGYSQWAGGEDYYRGLVREHTASDLAPEQLHQVGLQECAALAEQMATTRAALGFTGTEEAFHAQLASDPRVHATEPGEVEALFLRHMAALEPLISQWFQTLPQAPYGVARLEPALEAGMTYGYYEPPTPAQPAGRYRWNGAHLETKSLLTYATLIFHELAPGHHFHLARQSESAELPDVRRESMDIGAFNEGWAEYAAGLGWEMGLYDDPLDRYGRLVHERFTAQRLVVDTGLNLLGWSLDEAAAFMRANTTESEGQIASEVLRYSTDLPGQALSYRAGFLELNRIRRRAQDALADRFDIRDFHEQLLGPGALPFPVIQGHVDRWTADQTA